MKLPIVAANWKSNKNVDEAISWMRAFAMQFSGFGGQVIICPPFIALASLQREILSNNWGVWLGAQNVSAFESGAYTGEVSASMLKGLVNYAIIGHSERRRVFRESDRDVTAKIKMSLKNGITPIVCVANEADIGEWRSIPEASSNTIIVAFEPVSSIGTGSADSFEHAREVTKALKAMLHPWKEVYILYGGSVNDENVSSFTSHSEIDGVLVGGASLDAGEFMEIIRHATR